jgi:hypothetical protein
MDALVTELQRHAGGPDFRDDVSGVIFDWRGPSV